MNELSELFSQISNIDNIFEEDSSLYNLHNNTGPHSDNSNSQNTQKRKRIHTKYHADNIKRKINVKYFNFLVEIINYIIKENLREDYNEEKMKFCEFNYEFKKNVNKQFIDNLKQNSIISFLIKDKNIINKGLKNFNSSVYNSIIKKNSNFNNILDKHCFDFFPIFYYKIEEYEFDNQIINLSKMNCFYEDVLKKKNSNDEKYITNMESVINKHFLKKEVKFVVKKANLNLNLVK